MSALALLNLLQMKKMPGFKNASPTLNPLFSTTEDDSEISFIACQKLSEYDQEIPQSQTADPPKTSQGRATGH